MTAYLDSSFVVSLYLPDSNSARAASELANAVGSPVVSSFVELETICAFELAVFRKQISRDAADKAHVSFAADLNRRVFLLRELSPADFVRAGTIARRLASTTGCRASDILHVAVAVEYKADRFLTFDKRQQALARSQKLRTN